MSFERNTVKPVIKNKLFLCTVVVPTVIAAIYFGIFASDVYTSESSFVVISPERQSPSALGSLLRGSGFSRAPDDSFKVQEYILSRDALAVLVSKVKLVQAYSNDQIDRLSRFAGFDTDKSQEAFHRYYQKMVNVRTDSTSSITTLNVKAFTARDAFQINQLLIEQAESLVNRMNVRGREDMIKYARDEVNGAEAKAKAAALAVSVYRNSQGVVDPEKQAVFQLEQVAKLQEELLSTGTKIAQLKLLAPENPQIASLVNRATTLRSQISNETSKATGGEKSLAKKAANYERYSLESEFANKQLSGALVSLDLARSEAQRQQVYLERVAQPSMSDVAQDPKRLRSVLAVLALGLVVWGISSMLLAGVREHQS